MLHYIFELDFPSKSQGQGGKSNNYLIVYYNGMYSWEGTSGMHFRQQPSPLIVNPPYLNVNSQNDN